MLIAIHATVGAIVGSNVQKPVWSFILAFLLHFVVDMIPHGDANTYKAYKNKEHVTFGVALVVIDTIATILLVIGWFWSYDFISPASVAWGIAGGVLPDLLVGLYELSATKFAFLRRYHAFHFLNHNFVANKHDWKFWPGMAFQLIILVLIQIGIRGF